MEKKCIICNKKAEYLIKGTNNAYCEEHAEEFFGDTSYLAQVEAEANQLKDALNAQLDQLAEVKAELEKKK